VIGDHQKSGVFEAAGDGQRERRGRTGFAGEIRADVDDRDAAALTGAQRR
jgi:hypothetical protein